MTASIEAALGSPMTGAHTPGELDTACAFAAHAYQSWLGGRELPPHGPVPVGELARAGLAGLVHRALKAADDPRAGALVELHAHSLARTMLALRPLRQLTSALRAAGVPVLCIKGAATALRYCGQDWGIRPLGDVDLLVPRRCGPTARAVLAEQGYRADGRLGPITLHWASGAATTFDRDGVALSVDLHLGLHNWPLFRRLVAALWAREPTVVDGVPLPSVEDSLLVIAAHRAKQSLRGDPRELLDLRLLAADLDRRQWLLCVRRAVDFGLAGGLYVAYRHALRWFGRASSEDEARVAACAAGIGRLRRAALDRYWVASDAALTPWRLRHRSGQWIANHVGVSVATGTVVPPLAAAGLYAAARLADAAISMATMARRGPAPPRR